MTNSHLSEVSVYTLLEKMTLFRQSKKHYCALGIGFRVRVRVGVSGNTFSLKTYFRASVADPLFDVDTLH